MHLVLFDQCTSTTLTKESVVLTAQWRYAAQWTVMTASSVRFSVYVPTLLVQVLYLKYTKIAEWIKEFVQTDMHTRTHTHTHTLYQCQKVGTDGCLSLRPFLSSNFPPHHLAGVLDVSNLKHSSKPFLLPRTHTHTHTHTQVSEVWTNTHSYFKRNAQILHILGNNNNWSCILCLFMQQWTVLHFKITLWFTLARRGKNWILNIFHCTGARGGNKIQSACNRKAGEPKNENKRGKL